MIEEQNHVCAQTLLTAAQRWAALIADATVLAHATFGREAIARLQGRWHADDECAELRFMIADVTCCLGVAYTVPGAAMWWLGCAHWRHTVRHVWLPNGTPPAVAAERLHLALDDVRAMIAEAV